MSPEQRASVTRTPPAAAPRVIPGRRYYRSIPDESWSKAELIGYLEWFETTRKGAGPSRPAPRFAASWAKARLVEAAGHARRLLVDDMRLSGLYQLSRHEFYEVYEPDVKPPARHESAYVEGWQFNAYGSTPAVSRVWSEAHAHGSGPYPKDRAKRSASQGSIEMFSTKAKAVAALQHALAVAFAEQMYLLDEQHEEGGGDK